MRLSPIIQITFRQKLMTQRPQFQNPWLEDNVHNRPPIGSGSWKQWFCSSISTFEWVSLLFWDQTALLFAYINMKSHRQEGAASRSMIHCTHSTTVICATQAEAWCLLYLVNIEDKCSSVCQTLPLPHFCGQTYRPLQGNNPPPKRLW